MKDLPTLKHGQLQATAPLRRRVRVSTMRLLAVGALGIASPALGQNFISTPVTTATEFGQLLNNPNAGALEITDGNLDLSVLGPLTLFGTNQIIQGDGITRTLTGGVLTINAPRILAINPDAIWDGDIIVMDRARLDLTNPDNLSGGATVDLAAGGELRIFALGDTYDATFWAKITGVPLESTISFSANEAILTALPTFNADLKIVVYNSFQFDNDPNAPLTDPTVTLGASLIGAHNLTIDVGTLDLDDFDFTIGSISGAVDSEITLGSGTLTTGNATNTTYAGVISGTGNLVKTGTGSFTLSGVNTYSGTTTVSGGTLIFEADQTGTSDIIVESGGSVVVNADQTGDPTYTIQSGGAATFNADVDDATEVTIDAGGELNLNLVDQTLAVISGGGDINLGNGIALTVGDATNQTFSGMITGAGSLTKVGAGDLLLSGTSTYTGTTTLSEGTLTVDGALSGTNAVFLAAGTTLTLNGDIRDTASVSIASGAILDLNDNDETLGTVTGLGDIMLGTATLTVGTNANFTFGGTISETGGLTKQGNGTMTLSGAQTYTGATLITDGRLNANGDLATSGVTVNDGATFNLEASLTDASADLTIDDGGTFFGTSTIGRDLINNGTVTLIGPGVDDTITVNGDYTQGATGILNIQLGNAGGLMVAGTATLSGTLNISIPVDPANFDIAATYYALNAGTRVGTFSTVNDSFIFLDVNTAYTGTDVEITLARNAVALADIARTPNQIAVANVLDSLGAPTGNLDSAIDRILASSEEGALLTYDQLAGGGVATIGSQMASASANHNQRVMDRAVGIDPGSTRPLRGTTMDTLNDIFEQTQQYTLVSSSQPKSKLAEFEEQSASVLNPETWASFYGGFGDQGDGAEAVDYSLLGLLVGLEKHAEESNSRYGVSLGVEQTAFDLARSNGDIDITSLYLTGYAHQSLGHDFFATFSGSAGYHMHDSSRSILIGVTPTPAEADFNSTSFAVAAELSKAFHIIHTPADPAGHPTDTTIEPFVRIDYSVFFQDGYTETAAARRGSTSRQPISTACALPQACASSTST